jgi:methylated-DNA-protein-cysteine methyltransferase-like protein
MIDSSFREKVYSLMRQLPDGKVTTYGDIAALAGHAYAARVVGGIAHHGDFDLPWHRLVNRFGGLASGFPDGRDAQSQLLLRDGIKCTEYIIENFKDIRWQPKI